MDDEETPVEFKRNKRLIETEDDNIGHAGGSLVRKQLDLLDSPKLNKRGMSMFD